MKQIIWGCMFLGHCMLVSFGQDTPSFEGTITYEVELKGPQANIILQNEPNTQMEMHFKDAGYITNLKGGRYPKSFIFVADSNWEYSVDFSARTAYRYSPYTDRMREKKQAEPKVIKTDKTAEVLDVTCQVYKAKVGETYFLYYVNDQYRVDLDAFPEKIRARPFFLIEGLQGRIPLKVVKRQQGLTVVQTASSIKVREFSPEQFEIPPGFTVEKRDYRH